MRKKISIKTQRFLSVIPFANVTVLFIWIYNYRAAVNDSKVFRKSLLVIFAATVPLACIQMLLLKILDAYPTAVDVVNYLAIYVIPLSMSHSLIQFQKRLLNQ